MLNEGKCFEYIQQGYRAIEKKDFSYAVRVFGKVVEAYAREEIRTEMVVQALLGRSLAFKFQEKIDQTLLDLERCLLLVRTPDIFIGHNIHFDIGDLLYQRNEPEKALKHFDAALKHRFTDDKKKTEIIKFAVGCCVLLEREDEVIKYSKQGLLLTDDPFFHATILIRMKNLAEARAYAENTLVRFPRYLMLRYYYAVILHQMGEDEKALQELNFCLNKDPNFELANIFKVGLCLEKAECHKGAANA